MLEPREQRGAWVRFMAGALAAFAFIGGQALGQVAPNLEAMAPPPVTASSVFVMNAETGQVLYAKNPDTPFRVFSLTKLITAYVRGRALSPKPPIFRRTRQTAGALSTRSSDRYHADG